MTEGIGDTLLAFAVSNVDSMRRPPDIPESVNKQPCCDGSIKLFGVGSGFLIRQELRSDNENSAWIGVIFDSGSNHCVVMYVFIHGKKDGFRSECIH